MALVIASECFLASVAKPVASGRFFVFQNASVFVKAVASSAACSLTAAVSILSIAARRAVLAGPICRISFWNSSSSGVIGGGATFAMSIPVALMTTAVAMTAG